jgi:type II secretory pathway pseudopilin PulG
MRSAEWKTGFTLIELLVVVGILEARQDQVPD